MRTYNISEARTRLSRLVQQAAKGQSSVIAKAVEPMVKVVPLNVSKSARMKRFGFMTGQVKVPEDFNTMGAAEIQKQFQREK